MIGIGKKKRGSDYEMVTVTYNGNTLVALKVIGNEFVSKDEVAFTVDLTPNPETSLRPIELPENAAKEWGVKSVFRYPGQGRVFSSVSSNEKWIDGELLVIGHHFSFHWIQLEEQLFFTRPTPEMTLKLFNDNKLLQNGAEKNIILKKTMLA